MEGGNVELNSNPKLMNERVNKKSDLQSKNEKEHLDDAVNERWKVSIGI
jgi:hypothetical protein